ncbi:MAG TPA: hypothetical protein VF254_10035 [Gammaproteobacteria bacterium]
MIDMGGDAGGNPALLACRQRPVAPCRRQAETAREAVNRTVDIERTELAFGERATGEIAEELAPGLGRAQRSRIDIEFIDRARGCGQAGNGKRRPGKTPDRRQACGVNQ